MGIKKFKPTSPVAAGPVSPFEEISRSTPEKSLLRAPQAEFRPQQPGRIHDPAAWRRRQAPHSPGRFQADKFDIPARSRRSSTIPAARRVLPPLLCRMARSANILAPRACGWTIRVVSFRKAGDIRVGNCMPLRTSRWAPRCTTWTDDRKGGQLVRSAARRPRSWQGRRLCPGPHAVRRGAPGRQDCLATWGGGPRGACAGQASQGRPYRHRGRRPEVRGSAMTPARTTRTAAVRAKPHRMAGPRRLGQADLGYGRARTSVPIAHRPPPWRYAR